MEWLNLFGLCFVIVIMIPNIIFALKRRDGFENSWQNMPVEFFEQIGRFGCLALMIFNIPGTWLGFPSDEVFALYLIVNSCLVISYCLIWFIFFKRDGVFKALALSIIPSVVFLFSGIASRSVLLTVMAVIFAPCHILISYKNAAQAR